MLTPDLLHFLSAISALLLGGFGSGLGQGIAGLGGLQAISRQESGSDHVIKTLILGLALIETGVILSFVITLMLLFGKTPELTIGIGLAELGMGLAIGLSSAAVSISSSFAVKAACLSISRQPFFGQKIMTLMLLSQSIISAPGIFAFVVALLIKLRISPDMTTSNGIKMLASGLTIGIGSIGPSIGQAIFSYSSCIATGIKREAYGKILTFSLLSQAVIQTPVIFCLVLAITIIFRPIAPTMLPFISAVSFFTPAFTISVGIGYAASKSSYYVAIDEKNYPLFLRTSLLAQAIIESAAIYALIFALALMTRIL